MGKPKKKADFQTHKVRIVQVYRVRRVFELEVSVQGGVELAIEEVEADGADGVPAYSDPRWKDDEHVLLDEFVQGVIPIGAPA